MGTAVLAGAAIAPLVPSVPLLFPIALVTAWCLPGARSLRDQRRGLDRLRDDLPDLIDLLALVVSAGLNVRLAIEAVASRATGPLAAGLDRVLADCSAGRRLADALEDLPQYAGEPVRPLVRVLVSSERYGAPLSSALERLANEVRADRRRRAEAAARKVPVKLLFPLVSCTLPAFGLLTVAPLIAGALRSLRPY
jgi:tight adherence protein C